ncbi:MAG: hypothetical protein F6K40_34620 [Okeania sp. SIO3I5]|uniref:hypothetical protein n=1 Tax=Okeania sp. SIO3I5 TaxID=2607805 RepID=UPI0013BDE21F|nr:hypothetical protein [Okeania sp. SIO3I5]NEQ41073.1 hypothetical protein [Okeania sp. SIO3I5]
MSNSTSISSSASSSMDTGKRVNRSMLSKNQTCTLEKMKSLYQKEQQVKLLHLEAEIETLLLELLTIRERNLISQNEK